MIAIMFMSEGTSDQLILSLTPAPRENPFWDLSNIHSGVAVPVAIGYAAWAPIVCVRVGVVHRDAESLEVLYQFLVVAGV